MLKFKRLGRSIIGLLLAISFIMPLSISSTVYAGDSNYSCNLGGLWTNEVYLKPDISHKNIGRDFRMHFIDCVTVNGEIWAYYIKANTFDKLAVGLAKSTDGISFTDYGIVLDAGQAGSFDDEYASFPSIWYDNGVFYLAYEGYTGTEGQYVCLATSTNGADFTKQGIILRSSGAAWDLGGCGTPEIYKQGNTWYLYYHAWDGTHCQIGVATGSSLTSLTPYAGNPIIATGAPGSYNAGTCGKRDITYYNGYYYMVYEISTDMQPAPVYYSKSDWSYTFARSTDLIHWTALPQEYIYPMTDEAFGNDGPAFMTVNGETWIYFRSYGTLRARLANELNGGYDRVWEAENMYHQIGRADGTGWSANVVNDQSPGYLIYGPYVTDVKLGQNIAVFKAMIDNNSSDNAVVMKIEVNDATAGKVIASRDITRKEFSSTGHYEFFSLPYYNKYLGHSLEYRILWYGNSFLNVDRVLANYGFFEKYYKPIADLMHNVGRIDGDSNSWSANVVQDLNSGYLAYGPYDTNFNSGTLSAEWYLSIDNNTADNNDVVSIDVYDVDANTVLASRTVKRTEFNKANSEQIFKLPFVHTNQGHRLEFRTYWYRCSYMKLSGLYIR